MLCECRDLSAARRFFKQAINANGVPKRVVIDKSGANLAGLQAMNVILKFAGSGNLIDIRQVKYLNNVLEQDHRFIKRITRPMMGFKALHSAVTSSELSATGHVGYEDVDADRMSCLETLRSSEVRERIDQLGIELISYRDL